MLLESINRQLFLLINAEHNASAFTIHLAKFLADYLIFLVPLFLIGYWLVGNANNKKHALKSVFITFIALGIAQIIVQIYPHPRPFMIGFGRTLIPHIADPSFPSDHMTVFSSMGLTFMLARKYFIGLSLLVIGCVVGWSRIYLGVHFPFDMVGAFILAFIVALLFEPVWKRFGDALSHKIIVIYDRLVSKL